MKKEHAWKLSCKKMHCIGKILHFDSASMEFTRWRIYCRGGEGRCNGLASPLKGGGRNVHGYQQIKSWE